MLCKCTATILNTLFTTGYLLKVTNDQSVIGCLQSAGSYCIYSQRLTDLRIRLFAFVYQIFRLNNYMRLSNPASWRPYTNKLFYICIYTIQVSCDYSGHIVNFVCSFCIYIYTIKN